MPIPAPSSIGASHRSAASTQGEANERRIIALAHPMRLKGEDKAERLDLAVGITTPVMHTAKRERTGAADRPCPLRGVMQVVGMRESSIAGAPAARCSQSWGLRGRPSTQNTVVEWGVQDGRKSQGSGGNASKTSPSQALAGPTSRGQNHSARPRAHRHAPLTISASASHLDAI
jgi:hypothetical protein